MINALIVAFVFSAALYFTDQITKYKEHEKRVINITRSCYFLDFHRQRVPGTGANRPCVFAVVRAAVVHPVFRHAIPSVRNAVAHFVQHRDGVVLHQKGSY